MGRVDSRRRRTDRARRKGDGHPRDRQRGHGELRRTELDGRPLDRVRGPPVGSARAARRAAGHASDRAVSRGVLQLPASKREIIQSLIYPIPDPDLPFLGHPSHAHDRRRRDGGPERRAGLRPRGISQALGQRARRRAVSSLSRPLESSRALPQIHSRPSSRALCQVGCISRSAGSTVRRSSG